MKLTDPSLLRMQAYIGGKWENVVGNAAHEVLNPATQEKLGTVPDMGAVESPGLAGRARSTASWTTRS